ncbi:dTMP kinase [Halioxenophilus aromaticivorans]|uniref:Thymidylate kinase n=1 Tax=Halioxenophilus aromaticivorans TaxID=1306992 RepID=A0AAV3UBE6_9ALTE
MSKQVPGKFVTFEGVEGGGKSSNIAAVKTFLEAQGKQVVTTREPGGTPLAEEIRTTLLRPRDEPVDEMAELLLVFAARAQHFNTFIKPALAKGTWVLCDRFTDATYAYQGAGRGLSVDTIATLETLVQGDVRPDLTLLFDLDVGLGLERARGRGALDRFEQQEQVFFERIRTLYLQRAHTESYYRLVDASASIETVRADVQTIITQFLSC